VSERFLTIIYLVFAQTLPLATCFVFDKFFLRFLPFIESCFGFIWQMTSTKKIYQSLQRRSQEVNVAQVDFNVVFTSAKTGIILLTAREPYLIPLKNPEKTIWCNKMGKVEGKDGFRVTKNTKVCHVHFKNEDVLKVPGGSRWKLREGSRPIKHNFSTPRMKGKPPLFRCEKLKPKRLRFDEKNEYSPVCLHQPK